ncbi:MAG: hypothetical protein AAF990_04885 [Bacteroidota bacterium]
MNNRRHAWLKLIAGVGIFAVFIFGIAPAISNSDAVRPMINFIQEQDVDTGALFYTESPTTGEVEFYIKKNQTKQ